MTLAVACLASPPLRAETFFVHLTGDAADTNPGDGICRTGPPLQLTCTLRAAIQEANLMPGADEIVFFLSDATYTLSLSGFDDVAAVGDLDITDAVTLRTEPGARATLDGGTVHGLIDAHSPGVVIRGVAIIDSGLPVSVRAGASLRLEGTTISRLQVFAVLLPAVSVDSGGELDLVESLVTGTNGGGIFNDGMTIVDRSSVTGNSVGNDGGGILNSGSLVVVNSTVSGNMAGDTGGGIFSGGTASLTLVNATVTGNFADSDASFGGDRGGVSAVGNVTVKNSLIAGNVDSSGGAPDCGGSGWTSLGYNLIGNDEACSFPATIGDQVGTSVAPIDPLLEPLALYGGLTPTHALQAASPAVDAGNPSGCEDPDGVLLSIDQRGTGRQLDGGGGLPRCDIGAFEFSPLIFFDGFE